MVNWILPPELQERLENIQNTTRYLQKQLCINPMTLEERADQIKQRREEQHRKQLELEKIKNQIGSRRPPPKWKI